MPDPTPIVLSAIAMEATPTLDMLQRAGIDAEYLELGIGPLAATKALASFALTDPATPLIYLGSCGEFHNATPQPLTSLITTDTLYWSPPSVRSKDAMLVEGMCPPRSLPGVRKDLGLPRLPCFTSPAITLNATLLPEELRSGTHQSGVENMELYCAWDVLRHAQNLILILGITNAVGAQGHADWMRHAKTCSTLTATFLQKHLHHLHHLSASCYHQLLL